MQQQKNQDAGNESFPVAPVVYQPTKEVVRSVPSDSIQKKKLNTLMDVGVEDEAINQDNMQKIASMSREEIEAAQKAILE